MLPVRALLVLNCIALGLPAPAQPQPCPASLGKTSETFTREGSGVIPVFAAESCAWSASTSADWIQLITSAGTGFGEVRYVVRNNVSASARSAVIRIGPTLTFAVNESAAGQVGLSGTGSKFGPEGGDGTWNVEPHTAGAAWTSFSEVSWIRILTGLMGTGVGSVSIRVDPYAGALPRTGDVVIGGSRVTMVQSGGNRGMRFVPIQPCRAVDTRDSTAIAAGTAQSFLGLGACGIPAMATAYSLNVTVVPHGPLAYLTIWPAGESRPLVSTLNSFDGRIKANAAIVPAGTGGAISIFATGTTDVVLDVNGYFVPAVGANLLTTLAFASISSCRMVDTRLTSSMAGGETRTFQLASTNCSFVPAEVGAFALNLTLIPKSGPVAYLTVWPEGTPRPTVSTLNSPTGTVVANAAMVPSANGRINVFVTDAADVIIDMNGYFVPGQEGQHYYPLSPCRMADTRDPEGRLAGPEMRAGETRWFPIAGVCGTPSTETGRHYVLNATVVPQAALAFLNLKFFGFSYSETSTLNAYDGAVTSNLAICQGGAGGAMDAIVSHRAHLILDTSGYFAEP